MVRTTTAVSGELSAMTGIASRLEPPGMLRSRTSTVGLWPSTERRVASTSPASAITSMSCSASSSMRRPLRTTGWSSARTIVIVSCATRRTVSLTPEASADSCTSAFVRCRDVPAANYVRALQGLRLAAAVHDDEVRQHPGREPRGEEKQAELAVAVAAHAVPDLTDHVEDRAAGQRVEGELERIRGDVVADHRSEEGGRAADQAGQAQPTPGRLHVAERPHDPEALCRVVQGEADDQDRGKPDLPRLRRHADRQA